MRAQYQRDCFLNESSGKKRQGILRDIIGSACKKAALPVRRWLPSAPDFLATRAPVPFLGKGYPKTGAKGLHHRSAKIRTDISLGAVSA